eukprot:8877035-Pyramimonas_sp.AAC.1
MAEPDSDGRRPFAERSDGESVVSPMFLVGQTQGDERAPEGAQTEHFEEVKTEGAYEQHGETQPTTLEEDASLPEDKSLDEKKLEDETVKLEVKPEDMKAKLEVKLEDKKVKLEDKKRAPASSRTSSAPRRAQAPLQARNDEAARCFALGAEP